MLKKVLIITYYWPPAGGPGVQRWLKFVKYLPDYGIEPIVYIPSNPSYPIIDTSLKNEISDDVTIISQPINEPYKFAKFLSKNKTDTISKGLIPEAKRQSVIDKLLLLIRGNFFIPDSRKNWVKPSVTYLSNYIQSFNIDTIITTGPPHSLHLIGLNLKRELGVKWLADFRDPWTTIGYHKELKLTKSSQQKHQRLENDVLTMADDIIVTSSNTKSEFQNKTSTPITVITNGYDNEHSDSVVLDKKFSLAHIGSLLSKRNPELLWKAIQDLIAENDSFKKHFQLKLVGTVSDVVLNMIKSHSLTDYIDEMGYVSHIESIKIQKESQVLLLIEIDSEDTKCIIPGKLFEYMVSNRPILAFGPKHTDVEVILNETNTGEYFYYNDYDNLKSTIRKYFNAFMEGNLKTQAIGLQKYSRKALTKKLTEIL